MVDCIEKTGNALDVNNQGIVKYLCGIEEERNNLDTIIQKQYQERRKIEAEIEKLTYKLCLINKSLSMRIKAKNNYDKTIVEIKSHYEKLVDSSDKLRQIVEQSQQDLDGIMNKKTGTGSGTDLEIQMLYVKPSGGSDPDSCPCSYTADAPTKESPEPPPPHASIRITEQPKPSLEPTDHSLEEAGPSSKQAGNSLEQTGNNISEQPGNKSSEQAGLRTEFPSYVSDLNGTRTSNDTRISNASKIYGTRMSDGTRLSRITESSIINVTQEASIIDNSEAGAARGSDGGSENANRVSDVGSIIRPPNKGEASQSLRSTSNKMGVPLGHLKPRLLSNTCPGQSSINKTAKDWEEYDNNQKKNLLAREEQCSKSRLLNLSMFPKNKNTRERHGRQSSIITEQDAKYFTTGEKDPEGPSAVGNLHRMVKKGLNDVFKKNLDDDKNAL